uniref:Uncharacterized protein n=1 Tax=Clytia hemisphaerica TaxID=252671 RepID=A0A7M5V437_9CNID
MIMLCNLLFILVIFVTKTQAAYQNKLVVDCLNRNDNNGRYLINVFYADTSKGLRAHGIRGTCTPGSFQVHDLNERIGYAWVKGKSSSKAYIKVSSQQNVNGRYMYETWSYKGSKAFVLTSQKTNLQEHLQYRRFPNMIRCDGEDGRDRNGYCELSGPKRQSLKTDQAPYYGTVYQVKPVPFLQSTFQSLIYQGITKGGAIHGQYWDYRNGKWNKDDCYTFTARFSDGHSFEVTCPTKDFSSQQDATTKASALLRTLGQLPKFARSWLKTIAINGGGQGSRAGANSWRKSMTVNLTPSHINNAFTLFLHEGAHVGMLDIQNSQKWKTAQTLDPLFISSYAKGSPKHEDVSESFVPWLKVRQDPNSAQSLLIKQTIPNRLAVFDDLVCSKYPDTCLKI